MAEVKLYPPYAGHIAILGQVAPDRTATQPRAISHARLEHAVPLQSASRRRPNSLGLKVPGTGGRDGGVLRTGTVTSTAAAVPGPAESLTAAGVRRQRGAQLVLQDATLVDSLVEYFVALHGIPFGLTAIIPFHRVALLMESMNLVRVAVWTARATAAIIAPTLAFYYLVAGTQDSVAA